MTTRNLPPRSLSLLLPLLSLLAALLLAGCGQPDPTLSGAPLDGEADAAPRQATASSEIVFIAAGDVVRWSANSGELARLTDYEGDLHAAYPRMSQDGSRLAFVEERLDEAWGDLYLANRDGGERVAQTANEPDALPYAPEFAHLAAWAADPAWSASGALAWVSDDGGWVFDLGNRFSDPLFLWYQESPAAIAYPVDASVGLGLSQESPSFAPDGNRVALVVRADSGVDRDPELWTLDLTSGETTPLVETIPAWDPAWSPDGRHIVYVQRSEDGASEDLWVLPMNDTGPGEPYRLTEIGTLAAPVWSPDGSRIAFFRLSEDGTAFEIWALDVTPDASGRLQASDSEPLIAEPGIDPRSGMSWTTTP